MTETSDEAVTEGAGSGGHQPLHATDRRLDLAFAAITGTAPDAFLHCLQSEAGSMELPPMLAERLPEARWIPTETHALTYIDPSDHLLVHQAWLEACHGADRVARATVRTVQPLLADGEPVGPVGLYDITLVDLVGTDGIDAVVVTLTPVAADDRADRVIAPPPRGAASFRIRLDLEGMIIGGTSSVASLLGRSLTELLGQPVAELIHPDDLEAASGTWDDVLAKPDQSQTVRIRLRHGDGSWRWFHDTAWNALSDPDAPGILSEFHDIHALVEAEQALHASELGFRTLAESLPVGVTVLDQDGRVHFANHRLVTILTEAGLSGPESPTSPTPEPAGPGFVTNWTDLVDPAFAAEVADLVRPRDPSADAPVSRQVEVTRPDGLAVHLLVQAVTIWNHDGRSVIVSVQDVSEEVHTSRAHARLIQVVDEVDDVVIVCRVDDTIAYLNQAARRFLGDDAVGQRIKGFMPTEVRDITEGAIEPRLADNVSWKGDLEIVDLTGAAHTMDTTVRPVVDPSSQELHVGITMRDVTAQRAHERDLARQARHDTLTGLPNRFALMELLDAQRTEGDPADHLAVFFIDLDNLKIVNDGLGHSAGDRLLVAVAGELQRSADDGDTVARFGGDEFVVVCHDVGPDDALARAHRFLDAVQRAEVRGVSNHVSASIGVATSTRGGSDAESLIRDADAAMYAAKRAGRARCALFDEPLRERVTRRFQLEAALRSTIEDDALTVSFQPIVSLADGVVSGVEALCRWDQGSPADFIPIAEESGLILPLGAQVLAKSLQSAVQLRQALPHLAQLRIGINVSARELDQPDYAERTLEIIRASGMPMEQVVLELTESVLIDPRDEVDTTLGDLRAAGVSLALDDFGSGYSSLTYLRRYPLDVLKLDISYTQAMVHDPETRVIVETLVAMANRLGLRVVAEGVETEEQLDLVKQLEVTWVQGYLVGRPAPMEELLATGLPPIGLLSPG